MAPAPAFLQVLFYIVSLLAPAGTSKIMLSPTANPSDAISFTKTAAGNWAVGKEASEWKVDGEFVVMHSTKEGGKDERINIAPFVGDAPNASKALATHDWEKEKTLKLSRGMTVEKSDGGFILHMQKSAESPVVELRATFTK
ncbi:MAG: hypothetical protein ABI318_09275 [Chthoniobacteraceae bacterium]